MRITTYATLPDKRKFVTVKLTFSASEIARAPSAPIPLPISPARQPVSVHAQANAHTRYDAKKAGSTGRWVAHVYTQYRSTVVTVVFTLNAAAISDAPAGPMRFSAIPTHVRVCNKNAAALAVCHTVAKEYLARGPLQQSCSPSAPPRLLEHPRCKYFSLLMRKP
jgi:hypothetical protein